MQGEEKTSLLFEEEQVNNKFCLQSKIPSGNPRKSKKTSEMIELLEKGHIGPEEVSKIRDYADEKAEILKKNLARDEPNHSIRSDGNSPSQKGDILTEIPQISFSSALAKFLFVCFVLSLTVMTCYNGIYFMLQTKKKTVAGEFLHNFMTGSFILILTAIFYKR